MKATPPEPSVAILILTLNQQASTLRTLESLLPEIGPRVNILLWDNGSTDGTEDEVRRRYPGVLVHRADRNLGVAGGRNAAARMAVQRFAPTHFLFLDNDMVVTPGFVKALLDPFLGDARLAQAQAKLRFLEEPDLLNDGGGFRVRFWLGRTDPVGFREVDRGQRDQVRPCIACGGATMVRADVFKELGGFDETFNPFGPEDLDFSLRVLKRRYRALFVPSAMAYHAVSHTFEPHGYSEAYARVKARNWLVLMRRHAPVHQRMAFFLLGVPIRLVQLFLREGLSRGFAGLRGWFRGSLGRAS
jgi:hypothetical protein